MGELLRVTRATFDVIESRVKDAGLLARIKDKAKILPSEVRFTIEPGSEDAIALAVTLEGHGETGRTATALDRIRETCLGPTKGNEAAEKVVEKVVEKAAEKPAGKENVAAMVSGKDADEIAVNAEGEETPTKGKKNKATEAQKVTEFVSWRSLIGNLAAEVGVEPKGKKDK